MDEKSRTEQEDWTQREGQEVLREENLAAT